MPLDPELERALGKSIQLEPDAAPYVAALQQLEQSLLTDYTRHEPKALEFALFLAFSTRLVARCRSSHRDALQFLLVLWRSVYGDGGQG